MTRPAISLISLTFLTAVACDDGEDPPTDARADAASTDGAVSDAAPSDAAPSDAAPGDAAPSDAAPADAAPADAAPDATPSGAGFGAECSGDPDCGGGLVCRSVGMLGMVCTVECAGDDDCPPGSMGPKCNMMGLCRP